jgi:hypothetical protein
MHRQRVGVLLAADKHELPTQPRPEQRDQLVCLRLRRVIELPKLAAQRADRAAIALSDRGAAAQKTDSYAAVACS